MPDLLVRGVGDEIVRALKERAGARGRSAEAEHHAILMEALARPADAVLLRFWRQCPTWVSTRISRGSKRPNSLRMSLIDTKGSARRGSRPRRILA
jgi:hypothetical protein